MKIFPMDDPPNAQTDESTPDELPIEPINAPEPPPSQPRKSRRKLFLIVVTCVMVIGLAFVGYRYYHIRTVRGAIEPLVQNITLRTGNDLNYAIDFQKITYKELFDKFDKDKAEIDSKIIDLQTIESRFSGNEIVVSLKYARSCEALLRSLESKFYKDMEMNSAVEWNQKARDAYESSNYFGRYYAKKSYDEAVANFEKKSGEYDGSVDDFAKAIKDTELARSEVSAYLSDRFLLDPGIFSKLNSGNRKINRK